MPTPALFTAAGAITTQQNALSVISHNIANVNTTGFKSSSVSFTEQAGTLISTASAPSKTIGGKNPIEVGAGLLMNSVSTKFTQGAIKNTGISSDLAISGNGFFVISPDAVVDEGLSTVEYTRDGHFHVDKEGTMVTSQGLKLMAATFYDTISQKIKDIPNYSAVTFYTDQTIGSTVLANDGAAGAAVPVPTATALTGGTAPTFTASKLAELSVRGDLITDHGLDTSAPGNIEITRNADGKMVFTYDINTDADDDATTTPADTYSVAVDTSVQHTDNVITYELENAAGDKLQLRIRLAVGTSSLEDAFTGVDYSSSLDETDTLTFLASDAGTQATTDITVAVEDFEYMSTTNVRSLMDVVKLPSFFYSQDPTLEAETLSYNIEADGTVNIVGASSDTTGATTQVEMKLGRMLMANFTNPDGLINKGRGSYTQTSNSGTAAITVLGGPFDTSAPSIDGTSIVSGALEGSNVNLADQFAELITLQRGLQASARSFSAADEVLQSLMNL